MITLRLTSLQIDEIRYKLEIVADYQDLQESYEITEAEADYLTSVFRCAKPNAGYVTFEEKYLPIIRGEIEDLMEYLHANWKILGDEDDGATYRSLARVIRQIDREA